MSNAPKVQNKKDYKKCIYILILHQLHAFIGFSHGIKMKLSL